MCGTGAGREKGVRQSHAFKLLEFSTACLFDFGLRPPLREINPITLLHCSIYLYFALQAILQLILLYFDVIACL